VKFSNRVTPRDAEALRVAWDRRAGTADTEAPAPEVTKAVYMRPLAPRFVKEIGEDGPFLSAATDALFASLLSTGANAETERASSTSTPTPSNASPRSAKASSR